MHLVELALDFAKDRRASGGDFLVEVFQGRHFQPFVPKWRRPELYPLARAFRSKAGVA